MTTAQLPQEKDAGWEGMIGRYDRWLYQRVSKALKDAGLRPRPEQVVETVQEVYCRLLQGGPHRLRQLRRLNPKGTRTYLGRIAQSAVYDQMRAAGAAKRGGYRLLRLGRRVQVRAERVVDPEPGPERAAMLSEGRRLLLRRIRRLADFGGPEDLSARNVRIVWLAVVEGWKSREIARMVELTPRTIDTLLHRIRRRLAQQGLELRRR
jgi:RNA polymerase sigma factor (sigma-70 family)